MEMGRPNGEGFNPRIVGNESDSLDEAKNRLRQVLDKPMGSNPSTDANTSKLNPRTDRVIDTVLKHTKKNLSAAEVKKNQRINEMKTRLGIDTTEAPANKNDADGDKMAA
ncbi:hypothetical protein KKA13_02095 [Patescibacteria group bacterium]|nr:hypothetical protein [Patescibacteria group bacterium]MBU1613097.1 hypothetical protein [Patescibacteria group bacterium]